MVFRLQQQNESLWQRPYGLQCLKYLLFGTLEKVCEPLIKKNSSKTPTHEMSYHPNFFFFNPSGNTNQATMFNIFHSEVSFVSQELHKCDVNAKSSCSH